jgi:glutamyl/glutaminyl-tRNA synthetase
MRAGILANLLFAGLAFAQVQAPAPDSPPAPETAPLPPAPQAPPATPPPAEAAAIPPAEREPEYPDPEKLDRSNGALTRMRQHLKDVLEKLEEARNTKDVIKLNCVNEKLTQIKGLLRISEQADVSLQEAVAKRESSAAQHEFTKVTIAGKRVEQLRAEAEECIGQLAFRTDENLSVEVEEPEGLPGSDPTNPAPSGTVVVRAPPASPSL